jgi:hypothetical protein
MATDLDSCGALVPSNYALEPSMTALGEHAAGAILGSVQEATQPLEGR